MSQAWEEYGVFDSDGELVNIFRDRSDAVAYCWPERGDVLKVRSATKTVTEWRDQ